MQLYYFYSHISPWTFLGHQRFFDIAIKYDIKINYIPVTLSKIFPVSGGQPLKNRAPQRQTYRLWELKRWPDYLGLKINVEPKYFPVDDAPSSKMAIIAQRDGYEIFNLSLAFLRAVWQEERDITDKDTLISISCDCGIDGKKLFEESLSEKAEEQLIANCNKANKAQVFGSPTYVLNGEPFWGQDRLELLECELVRQISNVKVF